MRTHLEVIKHFAPTNETPYKLCNPTVTQYDFVSSSVGKGQFYTRPPQIFLFLQTLITFDIPIVICHFVILLLSGEGVKLQHV